MNRAFKGRALFHHRDSGGKAEMAPGQYVDWAAQRAAELNLSFAGTPERIEAMIQQGRFADGDSSWTTMSKATYFLVAA
jgi:hypothetical protein